MASFYTKVPRYNYLLCQEFLKHNTCVSGVRTLYSLSSLGVDNFIKTTETVKSQFHGMADRFRSKMNDFVKPDSVNMVFTEDLKNMIYLSNNTTDDMELIEKMILKYNSQNKDLRFGSFIFGPVVMRLYYHLNKPKEAFKLFTNPELKIFFDQLISYQILMDLLLKNEMYEEVLQVADIVKEKQHIGAKFPKNVVVLTLAACYKLNNEKAFSYMKKLWAEIVENGHQPMRRAVAFAAALSVSQNSPHIAIELISSLPKHNYVTLRNLKVLALTDLGRLDDVFPLLRSVLEMDARNNIKHTYCEDVIEKVKTAVKNLNKKEIAMEADRIIQQLQDQGHISSESLESYMFSDIESVRIQPPNQTMLAASFDRRQNSFNYQRRPQRQGLKDMT